jgi:hypothetical protein
MTDILNKVHYIRKNLKLLFLLCALSLILTIFLFCMPATSPWAFYYAQVQDFIPLMIFTSLCAVLMMRPRLAIMGPMIIMKAHQLRYAALIMAFAVAVIGYIGRIWIFKNCDLSRDEFMAIFDAHIFAAGHIAMPVEMQWQKYFYALQPAFVLPVTPQNFYVSNYLPVYAALRALWSFWADPALLNPLLAVVSLAGLYKIAQRLWPDDQVTPALTVLMLSSSPQLLLTSMSSYSANAHLAGNIIWLYLFMREDKKGYGACLFLGCALCGLHQYVFHLAFVVPFIIMLYVQNKKKIALIFVAFYAVITIFWIYYFDIVALYLGLRHDHVNAIVAGGLVASDYGGFVNLLVELASQFSYLNIIFMLLNLSRFVLWQNPLLIVLVISAWAYRPLRCEPIFYALTAGILLILAVCFLFVYSQSMGWGYRYLHMYLVNFALIAGYGWRSLTRHIKHFYITPAIIACFIYTLFFVIPFYSLKAYQMADVMADTDISLRRAEKDIILIAAPNQRLYLDFVRNDADLHQRPLLMAIGYLNESRIDELCAHYHVGYVDLGSKPKFGNYAPHDSYQQDIILIDYARRIKCVQ